MIHLREGTQTMLTTQGSLEQNLEGAPYNSKFSVLSAEVFVQHVKGARASAGRLNAAHKTLRHCTKHALRITLASATDSLSESPNHEALKASMPQVTI